MNKLTLLAALVLFGVLLSLASTSPKASATAAAVAGQGSAKPFLVEGNH
ncbi:hypothetical protein SAMN05444156_2836 [Verrucomicrobium sp. GAS474]|nr:hypothetical protein [Verrucomicrobium sp. GAS474]SDU24644.1 hypothetical protein SAMN05444156_2836 [Verrucomicrobium sp. GAS474]